MNSRNITYSIVGFLGIVAVLYLGKDLILPLAIAILIYYIILELKNIISKFKIKGKAIPEKLQSTFAFGIIVASLFVLGNLLYSNIQNITEVVPSYQENINTIISKFVGFEKLDISLIKKEWFNGDFVTSSVKIAIESLSGILSNSLLIFLYLIFIMLESSLFSKKIKLMYEGKKGYDNIQYILDNINNSMSRYISLKTITSLSTGVLSFIVLSLLGIDFAFFWAFLIFVLNYIPTIGSMIATFFPAVIALLQFGTFTNPLIVLVSIGSIQLLIGNVIEPKLMGNTLNVSPLVVLISLAFWGTIWGVTGMILSIPITIMIIISCSQFEATKWLAILLSENGEVLSKK